MKNKGLNGDTRRKSTTVVRSSDDQAFISRLLRKVRSPSWDKLNQHQREQWIKRAASKTYKADE
jgi:hypothetical protein